MSSNTDEKLGGVGREWNHEGREDKGRVNEAGRVLTVAVHRFLIARGWEQIRFVDGDNLWQDPSAHPDSHPEHIAYPTWLALTVQWYRDSQRPMRRVRATVHDVGSGRISGT